MTHIAKRALGGSIVFVVISLALICSSIYNTPQTPQNPKQPTRPLPVVSITRSTPPKNISQSPQPAANASQPSNTKQSAQTLTRSASLATFYAQNGKTYPLRTYAPLETNDPLGSQWWTTSTGLDQAWAIGSGDYETTVAMIDTGFALEHEEFHDRWATNSGESGPTSSELPSNLNCTDRHLSLNESCNLIDDDYDTIIDNESGTTTLQNPSRLNCSDQHIPIDKSCNQIDDDANDYIDDVHGWDFTSYDASVQAGEVDPDGSGTRHGTETTGILAATGNNGIGIAGVNWTTKILPLQAIDDSSYGNTLTVARAVIYAADRHADIISLSLGSTAEDPYLREAIQYAIDMGSLVVAASGNSGCDCMLYPASYPEVVAVGSHSSSNQPSSFSSYGNNLHILAPGENMTTTVWTKTNHTSGYITGVSGTSFATPYVSGILALARSFQPNATWAEIVASLAETADHSGLTLQTPTTSQLGSGRIRAAALLHRTTTPDTSPIRYMLVPALRFGTLSSNRVYDCTPSGGSFPTTQLYSITLGGHQYYTVDRLEYVRASNNGAQIQSLGHMCVGLPNDQPTVQRMIDLRREINTLSAKD